MNKVLKVIKIKLTFIAFVFLAIAVFILLTARTEVAGIKSYIVQTGSMQPTLPVGSIIFTQKSQSYQIGDIISFTNSGQTITHRIIEIDNNQYITQGDANNIADSLPVNSSQIIGKTVFHIPQIGFFMNQMTTPRGFILFIALPALLFIGMELWTIKNEIIKNTEKRVMEAVEKEKRAITTTQG